MNNCAPLRRCFREPIPEIFDAARYLDAAVSAHLRGHADLAVELLVLANDPKVWAWTDSIWGRKSPYVIVRKNLDRKLIDKASSRMPTPTQKMELHKRDGFHCRFCGIPVIRAEIRKIVQKIYPNAVP